MISTRFHRLALFSTLLLLGPIARAAPTERPPAPAFVPGEVLVQLRDSAGPREREEVVRRASGRLRERVVTKAMRGERATGLLRIETPLAVEEAIRRLQRDPNVAFAEPNWIVTADAASNDPYYTAGNLWGMYGDDQPSSSGPGGTTNAFGSQAEDAWAAGATGSRAVFVGIVDEGVAFGHPELAANVWTNPFDPPDGRDNDGNGYVDDVHGWDFFSNDSSVYDGTDDDHGTHVAGTIGASGGNGAGVAGACWQVTMIPTKFLGPSGGSVSNAVKALDYLGDLKTRHGLNIVVANCSWSTTGYSQSLNDAVIRAAKRNILVVASAGNSTRDNDATNTYPANFDTTRATTTQTAATYDGVIAVAAIDRNGALASFSNWGATRVDLGAPGVAIVSTYPPSGYASYNGTSMAAPHVSGAIALYVSTHPGVLGPQLRSAILSSVTPTPSLSGKTVTGGRLNMSSFAAVPVTHDVAITSFVAPASVARGTSVALSVTAANRGTATETFTVSVTDAPPSGGTAGTMSAPRSVTLAAGASVQLAFTWTTSNASVGTHVLRAAASQVSGETRLADNALSRSVSVTQAPRPVVSSISPASMRTGSAATMTVNGSGFAPGARLTFTGGLGTAPVATNVVLSGSTRLTARVSATGATASSSRYWTAVVTNPDGQSGSLSGALRIMP